MASDMYRPNASEVARAIKVGGEGTIVLLCSCRHEFQDQQYGVGKRLHNRCPDGKARCTVCGTVRDA